MKKKFPTSASIAITYQCNSKCVMCDIWKKKREKESSPDVYKRLPNSLREIDITGGEPFLRDDLPKIVKALRETCPKARILIITNGFLSGKIKIITPKLLKTDKNLAFRVSLDGWGKTHDEIRRFPGGFKKARDSIKILRKNKVRDLGIIFTLTRLNKNELSKLLVFCKKEKIQFSLNLVHDSPISFGRKKSLRPTQEEVNRSLKEVSEFFFPSLNPKNWAKAWFYQKLKDYIKSERRAIECGAGESFFYLDPNGDVYLCQFKNRKIGNFKKQSFKQIWEGERRSRYLKMKRNCHDCFMICSTKDQIKKNKILIIKSLSGMR